MCSLVLKLPERARCVGHITLSTYLKEHDRRHRQLLPQHQEARNHRGDDAGRARAAGVARVLRPRPLAHNAVGERPRLRDGRRRRDHVVAMVAEPTSVSTAGRGGGRHTTRRNRGAFLIPTRSYSSYNSNHTRLAPYKGSASATSSAAFFPEMIWVSMQLTGDSMFA